MLAKAADWHQDKRFTASIVINTSFIQFKLTCIPLHDNMPLTIFATAA